ncbi:MAG: DUF2889 domain-containing protein [Desulfitobacteriaceae bacterium]|nr:DUF2889 domain-containing protein [Desulfitobacteriaceae bacterium]MDD4401650.1 DUF2889 domain-containing protein [Desulfitobacteriaceae bacterium]
MKSLFQCNWYTEVNRTTNRQLKSKTSYLDTQREAAACLLVDTNTFIIGDAVLEEQRSFESIGSRSRQVAPLIGSQAHLGAGPNLKKTAAFLDDPLAVALFAESIKGIIQAERFLLEERGYASLEDFFLMWRKNGLNSCCLYSNLDRVAFNKIDRGDYLRPEGNLFVRFKTQNLYRLGQEQYLLTGYFSDSRHETSVILKLKGTTVIEADGGFVRAPNPICPEADIVLSNLLGVDLKGLAKKEIAAILGKGQGCVHMIDLVNDCTQILSYLQLSR